MSSPHDPDTYPCGTPKPRREDGGGNWPRWVGVWTLTCTLASGILALVWLILRSGPKPSRLTYPCQQAALSAAGLALGGPIIATLVASRRRTAQALRSPLGIAAAVLLLVAFVGIWGRDLARVEPFAPSGATASGTYRAEIYQVTDCPMYPVGTHFPGLDNLLMVMGYNGEKFYESATSDMLSGPDGIIAADDVVIIKINYQWPERGGTNTDVLRGLISRLVEHPDGFTGEIVVCENAQFNSIDGFDRALNNSVVYSRSPHDVVMEFAGMGYEVSHYDWTVRRYTSVDEYSTGDMTDGYIVYPYDSGLHGRPSYPKFQTDAGTYVSLEHGIWDTGSSSYSLEHLKFINVPVLKSHHATYGATACVKHYMGVVSGELGTSSHSAIYYGLMGNVIGHIRPADLNILDCVWIHANPYDGPWTEYNEATRKDILLASTDPVALDRWAVKNVLIPTFYDEGYAPPWPSPSADPDNPSSHFRQYLDHSMDEILAAGFDVTNDYSLMDVYTWDGDLTEDCNANGVPDAWDLADGTLTDADGNGLPDECDFYVLEPEDAEGSAGQSGVPVFINGSSPEDFEGFSFGVDFDETILAVDDLDLVGTVADGADFFAPNHDNAPGEGWFTVGCVYDFSPPIDQIMAACEEAPFVRALFSVASGAVEGDTAEIAVVESIGSPAVAPVITIQGGVSMEPILFSGIFTVGPPGGTLFSRGDVNNDNSFDISDPVYALSFMFSGGDALSCDDAGDANDDGGLDIADAVYMLAALFTGGPSPTAPHPGCGIDPTADGLDCAAFTCP